MLRISSKSDIEGNVDWRVLVGEGLLRNMVHQCVQLKLKQHSMSVAYKIPFAKIVQLSIIDDDSITRRNTDGFTTALHRLTNHLQGVIVRSGLITNLTSYDGRQWKCQLLLSENVMCIDAKTVIYCPEHWCPR